LAESFGLAAFASAWENSSNLELTSPRHIRAAYTNLKEGLRDAGNRKVVQRPIIQPDDGGKDCLSPRRAAERAGIRGLNEGQKASFEVVADPRTGKASADSLRTV
jgi:cold shock protein